MQKEIADRLTNEGEKRWTLLDWTHVNYIWSDTVPSSALCDLCLDLIAHRTKSETLSGWRGKVSADFMFDSTVRMAESFGPYR
ncbi:hypothetical protein Tdes44962_MAKER04364 [Teratosphaeria destructans]|uniref:Uncharacterized protein n=1 Tax=Teratosphaeria destructans TaxID=418781 RepID=A0A9W7SMF3_9PEZI|nr:hypothetical protein Tdes44962_MAKER04364 [Teratosphaeria destructans]